MSGPARKRSPKISFVIAKQLSYSQILKQMNTNSLPRLGLNPRPPVYQASVLTTNPSRIVNYARAQSMSYWSHKLGPDR